MKKLKFDPLNIVVCGIGGQGNVLAAEVLGSAMCDRGFRVAVGETYGASQRGGSVMSHVRVSAKMDPSGSRRTSSSKTWVCWWWTRSSASASLTRKS